MPSHRHFQLGDLVRLDPKKYNKSTSEMVGVVSKIDDSGDWRIISITWAGEREETSHLPTDLEEVKC